MWVHSCSKLRPCTSLGPIKSRSPPAAKTPPQRPKCQYPSSVVAVCKNGPHTAVLRVMWGEGGKGAHREDHHRDPPWLPMKAVDDRTAAAASIPAHRAHLHRREQTSHTLLHHLPETPRSGCHMASPSEEHRPTDSCEENAVQSSPGPRGSPELQTC